MLSSLYIIAESSRSPGIAIMTVFFVLIGVIAGWFFWKNERRHAAEIAAENLEIRSECQKLKEEIENTLS